MKNFVAYQGSGDNPHDWFYRNENSEVIGGFSSREECTAAAYAAKREYTRRSNDGPNPN